MSERLEAAARKMIRANVLQVMLEEGGLAPNLKPRIDRMAEDAIKEIYAALGYDMNADADVVRLGQEAVAALKVDLGK